MTDQVTTHPLELTSPPASSELPKSGQRGRPAARPDDIKPPVRSDIGTILLHWTLVVAIVVSLLTGIRFSTATEGAWFGFLLDPILPQGEIWTWHYISAVFVLALIFAYAAYMSLARLKRRISSKKIIVLTLPASTKLRVAAVNVAAYWLLFACVLTLTVTGVVLYLGYSGLWVTVHYWSALVVLTYIFAHVVLHYAYGGVAQLLRLFRPQALRRFPGMAAHPLAIALAIGAVVLAGAVFIDFGTRSDLTVARADKLPVLDGRLDDTVWQNAEPVFVETQLGSNYGGTGGSTVEIRALHVGDKVAFGFRWSDASFSLKRHPLIKKEDGWHILNNNADRSDETAYYEDKFAVLLSKSDQFGGGGASHMGTKPLSDKPAAFAGVGLHYTTDGSLADVWQWKSARGGMLGYVDDMSFSTPLDPTPPEAAGTARYKAGYHSDKGKAAYDVNYIGDPETHYHGVISVKRLPIDYKKTVAKMGTIDLSLDASVDDGSQWWMFKDETVPYSPEKDAEIPVGTILPGVLIMNPGYDGHRADLKAGSHWQDGYWTLEIMRDMDTGDEKDLAMEDGLYMWVSSFDHVQIRHTRHSRPVRLTFE